MAEAAKKTETKTEKKFEAPKPGEKVKYVRFNDAIELAPSDLPRTITLGSTGPLKHAELHQAGVFLVWNGARKLVPFAAIDSITMADEG